MVTSRGAGTWQLYTQCRRYSARRDYQSTTGQYCTPRNGDLAGYSILEKRKAKTRATLRSSSLCGDDFVVFGQSREECETAKIKLRIWLAQRGLALSEEKTSIKHLKEGFDFLGFKIRHYDNRHRKRGYILLTKPSKESMKRYKQ